MSKKRSILAPSLLIGGGLAAGVAAVIGWRKSVGHTDSLAQAVEGTGEVDPDTGERGVFQAKLTGYWPKSATAEERKMEGGMTDRKGQPLHSLEDFQKDPVKHPFVSVAGDYEIFPYGQRLEIDAWPGVVFRVVDTGGHFHGAGKLYRIFGAEPLDINVDSSKTKVPHTPTRARIVAGDNFEKGKAVAAKGFTGQTVMTGEQRAALAPWVGLLGDAYSAAKSVGDEARMKKFARLIRRYS